MWHRINYVLYSTMYNFDEISPGCTAFIQPSKRASINITKAKCFLVSRYTCANVRICVCAKRCARVCLRARTLYASVCVRMCMYVCNKGQRKGSVYSSYWRPRRSMRVGCLSTLTIRTLTHQGTITTHTRAVKYHGRMCLSYFSPWTQVYNHLCRFTWHFQVFHFVCYIIYVCYFIYPYATSSCRRRAGAGDRET